MSKRTIKCKMAPTPVMIESLRKTCDVFAEACNSVLDLALPKNISNNIKLHHLAYKTIRQRFGLSANLAVRAIRRVSAAMVAAKRRKKKPFEFHPTSVDYDARIFDYREKDETVSLTVIGGRIHIPLVLGTYQRDALRGKRPTAATVVRSGRDWYIHIVVEDTDESSRSGPALGVDLGIRNIATLSNGKNFAGKELQKVKNQFRKVRSSLQSKGTPGARCVLKRLSGRERRRISWENHNLSRVVVREAVDGGFGTIRMENLKGIRDRTRTWNRHLNRMMSGWSFGELQRFIRYKAERSGIAVEFVNPSMTSQTCHVCLSPGVRNKETFSCTTCGVMDADINASANIAAGGVAVSTPESGQDRVQEIVSFFCT